MTLAGGTKFNDGSQRTYQINCGRCKATVGFLTTKHYLNVTVECKKCYIERISNDSKN